ncbi:hypothetical protein [Sphaerimonospora thailandensis]|uniref:Uncharacterized protein n=1 Tax=Sphaerimonospora thailandensis TaxID=795644 RepID=A0A8J3VYY4_9ACTN|nr:hypothetical protein [Sphaerimonospora thailandensis]GIH69485.1 hypothetical protein Mth01_17380 [Sphaerimonospora thailandensis]
MTTTIAPAAGQQRTAALVLAHLLTIPAPEIWTWEIREDGTIRGQLYAVSLDQTRIALHQWTPLLDGPVWEYEPYGNTPTSARLAVTGTYQGVTVQIWNGAPHVPGLTAAELSTPPLVDAPDVSCACDGSGSCPVHTWPVTETVEVDA